MLKKALVIWFYSSMGMLQAGVMDPDIFIRGDVNNNHQVDASDPVYINKFLFQGGPPPSCMEQADANDDGAVDNSDTIYLLYFLYYGGPQPSAPFPTCGQDQTADSLSCFSSQCTQ